MTIKASDILASVKALGIKHPRTKRECKYFYDDGKPCCIVGRALHENGMKPDRFIDDEDLNRNTGASSLFMFYEDLGLVNDLTSDQMSTLNRTQERQDDDAPWGEAIKGL